MFENCGEKIKAIGYLYFGLVTIASIVLAFVYGINSARYGGTSLNAAIFFPLLLGGPFFAWISSIFIVGFGKVVDYCENPSNPESTANWSEFIRNKTETPTNSTTPYVPKTTEELIKEADKKELDRIVVGVANGSLKLTENIRNELQQASTIENPDELTDRLKQIKEECNAAEIKAIAALLRVPHEDRLEGIRKILNRTIE